MIRVFLVLPWLRFGMAQSAYKCIQLFQHLYTQERTIRYAVMTAPKWDEDNQNLRKILTAQKANGK